MATHNAYSKRFETPKPAPQSLYSTTNPAQSSLSLPAKGERGKEVQEGKRERRTGGGRWKGK
jgi:hypothetical protein